MKPKKEKTIKELLKDILANQEKMLDLLDSPDGGQKDSVWDYRETDWNTGTTWNGNWRVTLYY